MSEHVNFESDNYNNYPQQPRQQGGMVGWLIKHNFASSPAGANAVLIGVIVVVLAITAFVLIKFS